MTQYKSCHIVYIYTRTNLEGKGRVTKMKEQIEKVAMVKVGRMKISQGCL